MTGNVAQAGVVAADTAAVAVPAFARRVCSGKAALSTRTLARRAGRAHPLLARLPGRFSMIDVGMRVLVPQRDADQGSVDDSDAKKWCE